MRPLHFSQLKWMGKSPAHYRYALTAPFAATPAMKLGTLVHQRVLGGPEPIVFEGDRRGKAWDNFKAEHEEDEIYTSVEMEKAEEIAFAVLASPFAELLEKAEKERVLDWRIADRPCAGRIDAYGERFIADLKTTSCSEPGKFPRDAMHRGYLAQLSWYAHGLAYNEGPFPTDHYLLAVETTPPYPVVLYRATPRAIDAGEKLWRSWFERLRVCEETDEWPGYALGTVDLDLNDFEDELNFDGVTVEAA